MSHSMGCLYIYIFKQLVWSRLCCQNYTSNSSESKEGSHQNQDVKPYFVCMYIIRLHQKGIHHLVVYIFEELAFQIQILLNTCSKFVQEHHILLDQIIYLLVLILNIFYKKQEIQNLTVAYLSEQIQPIHLNAFGIICRGIKNPLNNTTISQ